jgi:hypothetical protein
MDDFIERQHAARQMFRQACTERVHREQQERERLNDCEREIEQDTRQMRSQADTRLSGIELTKSQVWQLLGQAGCPEPEVSPNTWTPAGADPSQMLARIDTRVVEEKREIEEEIGALAQARARERLLLKLAIALLVVLVAAATAYFAWKR